MAKFRLDAPHFFEGHYLEAGAVVECDAAKASRRMTRLDKFVTDLDDQPESDGVTAEEIAEAVAAVRAEPKEGELTSKGNPTKAAVEARVGKPIAQALFMAAIQ